MPIVYDDLDRLAELVRSDSHFIALARSIDQNPVRAGLCRRA